MKKTVLILLAALTAFADLAIKAAVRTIPKGVVFFSLPPFFDCVHTTNTGAAFSLFAGNPIMVLVLPFILMALLAFIMLRAKGLTGAARAALACTIGGGLGNWIERVLVGGVTDYIRVLFIHFPIFNFADICVSLSIVYLMILLLTGRLEEKPEDNHGKHH